MVTKDLGVRFTEEKYATKIEVQKDLQISLVDNIWSNILAYRNNFNRSLIIRSIEGNQLNFCYSPGISDNVNQVDFKIIRLLGEAGRILNSNDAKSFKLNSYINNLRYLSKEYKLDVTDSYLRSIINGDLKDISNSYKILPSYFNALQYVEKAYVNPVNEDFLAEIYSRIIDTDELVSFYRTTEDRSKDNRVLIDRIYTAAPTGAIEGMMDSLFDFIEKSTLSLVTKAIVTYYYINYVKPFPSYNDEIAVLMMKAVLAHNDIGQTAVLMPLEKFLVEYLEENAKNCVEVQKTSDITYFINFALRVVSGVAQDLLDQIAAFSVQVIRNDYYRLDDEPEEVKPQEEPQQQELEENAEEIESTRPQTQAQVEVPQLAVAYIPPILDEKEATRLEQDLLESDPSLKKGEAHFYARHCTMNKRYTIAQYKKSLGCAYETARTSMEHLVTLGYYRKEQIKNKFIYTPVLRRKGE